MKQNLIVAGLCAAGLLASGAALAADTATVTVSAAVVAVCKFSAPKTGALSFGSLDPSVGGDVNGTPAQPQFWCTKGTSYTISDDDGLYETGGGARRMQHATLTEHIPYSFTYTATGTGNGASNALTMNIAGTVLAANYLNASAGAYADTVTLSINP